MGSVKNKRLFLKAGKATIKVPTDLVSGKSSLSDLQMAIFLLGWKEPASKGKLSYVFSYKDANPIMKAPPSGPGYLPQVPYCKTITGEFKFKHEFGGT